MLFVLSGMLAIKPICVKNKTDKHLYLSNYATRNQKINFHYKSCSVAITHAIYSNVLYT